MPYARPAMTRYSVPWGGYAHYGVDMPQAQATASAPAANPYAAGFNAQGLWNDYTAKYNQARGDNLARYDEGKQGYTDRYNRGMANLEGLGAQELSDIRQQGEGRKAQIRQNMTNLGLGGTTVGSSLASGSDRATNADLGRAQERIRQQRIGLDADLSKDKLDFIERRTDAYPDFGSYASLMSQMGSMAGGAGGAGNPYAPAGTVGAGGSPAPASPMQQNPYSTIRGDTGLMQPVFTKQPNGSKTMFNLTPLQMQLSKNPFLLGG